MAAFKLYMEYMYMYIIKLYFSLNKGQWGCKMQQLCNMLHSGKNNF